MKTCLVVDGSSVTRKTARRILETMNFQIVKAENGIDHIARALCAGSNERIIKPFEKDLVAAEFPEVGQLRTGALT
jgi:two-component system chemotaxis response regulator CheY